MSLKARIEAVLFLTDKPIRAAAIAKIVNVDVQLVRQALIELVQDYETRSSGLEIASDDGYIIQVKDEYASIIDEFLPVEMSHAHIRTLSAIAIKQPIPQSDIIKIRGAGAYDHIKELLEKELINKDENQGGRSPILTTTKKFQEYFRLTKDAKSLRTMLRKQDKPETPEGEPGDEVEGYSEEDAQQLLLMAQSIAEGSNAPQSEFAPDAGQESIAEATSATDTEVTVDVADETETEVVAESTEIANSVAEDSDDDDDSDDDNDADDDEDSDDDEESDEDVADSVKAKDESEPDEDDEEDDDDDSDDDDDDEDNEDDEDESEEAATDSKTFSQQPVEMDEPFSPHSAAPDSVNSGTTDFSV